ncbi:MAG: hypothetical protein ACK57E_00820 [Erythrobacteraceae bacterium]|jgi:hypothetical protein
MIQQGEIKRFGFRELDLIEIEAVSGGAQPIGGMLHKDADPMAAASGNLDAMAIFGSHPFGFDDMIYDGINPWVPDRLENTWYGRTALPSGEAYEQNGKVYTFYDKFGNKTGDFVETTQHKATKTITTTSGNASAEYGGFNYNSGSTTVTTYLKPKK